MARHHQRQVYCCEIWLSVGKFFCVNFCCKCAYCLFWTDFFTNPAYLILIQILTSLFRSQKLRSPVNLQKKRKTRDPKAKDKRETHRKGNYLLNESGKINCDPPYENTSYETWQFEWNRVSKGFPKGFKLLKPGFQRVSKKFPKGFQRVSKEFERVSKAFPKGFKLLKPGF